MVRWFVALLATVAFSCAAGAQNLEVIEKRKAAFKDYLKYVKPGTGMVRGQASFDLAQAKAVFTGISENSMRFDAALFPEDSKTGGKTESLPVIWEKQDDFFGRFEKLAADAKAAAEATTDEASFKANWGKVLGNCGACHKIYRKPKG